MRISIVQLRRIVRESVDRALLESVDTDEVASAVATATAGVSKERLSTVLEDSLPLFFLKKFLSLPKAQAAQFFPDQRAWLLAWQAADAVVYTRDLF